MCWQNLRFKMVRKALGAAVPWVVLASGGCATVRSLVTPLQVSAVAEARPDTPVQGESELGTHL
ncbi:MAG: hypothetical protein AB8H79_05980 [Myxococcota bacterium]